MKAVILCAGKSTRMCPLTVNKPKVLLKVMNKTLLEHNLKQLEGLVNEVVLIIGFKGEMIKKFIGNSCKKIKIKFVEQKKQLGTGHALPQAEKMVNDKFIVLMGDDLYSREDIRNCLKNSYCILAKEVRDPEKWGILSLKNNFLEKIDEKPEKAGSTLANTGLYVLNKGIFDILKKIKKSKRNEIELTDAVNEFVKKERMAVEKVKGYWLPIGYPWHLLDVNEFFLKKLKRNYIKGKIHKNVHIEGKLILGKGSKILPGTNIEGNVIVGENCKIGPNTYFRGYCSIGNNCRIGNAEVKNSIFFDGVRCDHTSYIGDSILGEKAHIGAGTVTANLRHDKGSIKTMIKGELIDTKRRKFGAVIGDNTDLGINTSIYPGRKIWSGKTTLPGEVVKRDVE